MRTLERPPRGLSGVLVAESIGWSLDVELSGKELMSTGSVITETYVEWLVLGCNKIQPGPELFWTKSTQGVAGPVGFIGFEVLNLATWRPGKILPVLNVF